MLQTLRISHFAIIDALAIELDAGFTVLTGETGAGKSILVDAINLIMGGRASAELIRTGEDSATVEALFTRLDPEVRRAAEAGGVELEGDELLVKRVVSRSGKNKVFLNGGPATLGMLEALGPKLIDISGQHEHQTLLLPDAHRAVVDAAGGHEALVVRMREAHGEWARLRREADALAEKERDRAQREDYLRFQVDELKKMDLSEGEDERLEIERQRLVHAESLTESVTRSEEALYSEDGAIVSRLKAVQAWIAAAARIDPELAPLQGQVDAARVELEDVARALRDHQGAEANPERLREVDDRLVALDRLRKKHGFGSADGVGPLIELEKRLATELDELASFDATLSARRAGEAAARKKAEDAAGALTAARKKAARTLAAAVQAQVRELGMPHTRIDIAVREASLAATGADEVEFLIAPNPGEDLKALARTASGGELSRVMLALKCVVAEHHPVASYVFDEVDAGIGGAIAETIGQTLAQISVGRPKPGSRAVAGGRADGAREHQVLCITHLPQVASLADAHLKVAKSVSGGRTAIEVTPLDADSREDEIARMLGGLEITAATRAHAREMLTAGTRKSTAGTTGGATGSATGTVTSKPARAARDARPRTPRR